MRDGEGERRTANHLPQEERLSTVEGRSGDLAAEMMEQVGIRGRGSDSVCSQDSVQILEGTGEDRQGKNGFNASSKQPVSSRTRSRQVSKTGGDRETGQQGAEPELLVPRRRMRRTPMKIIGKKRAANDEIIERKDRMTHPSKLESRKDPEFAMKLYESGMSSRCVCVSMFVFLDRS